VSAKHREIARAFRAAMSIPAKLDCVLTYGDITTAQRNALTDAHNHACRCLRALGCICISEVSVRQYGTRYGVQACGVQIATGLGLDGALSVVRQITGRSHGDVCFIPDNGEPDGALDIRPFTECG
jgi:hypothetical protein